MHNGIFPEALKLAKVTVLYKGKGEDTNFENYRPISLLSIISKIYERAVFNQLYEFFQSKKLFYESQYGFRKNHSTEHAALELFDRVAKDVDDQNDIKLPKKGKDAFKASMATKAPKALTAILPII